MTRVPSGIGTNVSQRPSVSLVCRIGKAWLLKITIGFIEPESSARWLLQYIATTGYSPVWLQGSSRGVRLVMVLVVHPTNSEEHAQMKQNHLINNTRNPANLTAICKVRNRSPCVRQEKQDQQNSRSDPEPVKAFTPWPAALSELLKGVDGDRGVLTEASSNKAARLIQGKTLHAANKLQGTSSLRTVHLRITQKQQKALGRVYGELGAKILDEFSQTSAKLLHCLLYTSDAADE